MILRCAVISGPLGDKGGCKEVLVTLTHKGRLVAWVPRWETESEKLPIEQQHDRRTTTDRTTGGS
jgi:hypothetical protein